MAGLLGIKLKNIQDKLQYHKSDILKRMDDLNALEVEIKRLEEALEEIGAKYCMIHLKNRLQQQHSKICEIEEEVECLRVKLMSFQTAAA